MEFDFIKKDKRLKLICLTIAIIIWFYIMGDLGYNVMFLHDKKNERTKLVKAVPVYILENAKDAKSNIKINPQTIDIRIKGKEKQLSNITKKDIIAYIDISEFDIGTYFAIIKINVPKEINIVGDIKTATVEIGGKISNQYSVISDQ